MIQEIKISKVRRMERDSKLKAFVDVLINGIHLKGFRVISGDRGFFVANPSEKRKDPSGVERYYDIVYFDSLEDKKQVERVIIEAYEGFKELVQENLL